MRISKKPYVGIDKDTDGGMNVAGRIIPETETCEGWDASLQDDD